MSSPSLGVTSPSVPTPSSGRLPKRKRVALACAPCRKKKLRCDGTRPSCSTCRGTHVPCHYERLQSPQSKKPTYAELAQKVRELEAQLPLSKTLVGEPSPIATEPLPMDDESTVDALASNAFDEVPKRDIGYFGQTSNHALFRILSSAFLNQLPSMCPSQRHYTENSLSNVYTDSPNASADFTARLSMREFDTRLKSVDPYTLPGDQELRNLVNCFYTSVGVVLPCVDNVALSGNDNQSNTKLIWQTSKSGRALLNIICAHSKLVIRSPDAELFYRRTLLLLDDLTLRGSSLELVQTLLLLCRFQQNTQRSIASWTYHAVAVKAAIQLGLHAPALYEEHGKEKRELLKRVWFSVIIQDSCLSVALGRPCLIPVEHIQIDMPCECSPFPNSVLAFKGSQLCYFKRLIASVVQVLHDRNMGSPHSLCIQDIIVRRLQLICELERWKSDCSSPCAVVSSAELDGWSASSYDANRFRIVLSLQYYFTALLINRPVLTNFITQCVPDEDVFHPCMGEVTIAIVHDLHVARELSTIVNHISMVSPDFISKNSIWWTCNYGVFTVMLHLFSILLTCYRKPFTQVDKSINVFEVRAALTSSLQTLEAIERSSLMSRKGRHCLQRFLQVLDSFEPHTEATASASAEAAFAGPIPAAIPDNIFAQLIAEPADSFMLQSSQLDFLDTDISMANFQFSDH